MIAWETGFATDPPKFYFYGKDTIIPVSGYLNYTFSLTLPSKLPLQALRQDTAAKTAVAVGHVFLVDTTVIKTGMVMDTATFNNSSAVVATATYNNDPHDNHVELLTIFYRNGLVETPGLVGGVNLQDDSVINSLSYDVTYNLFQSDAFSGTTLRPPGAQVLLDANQRIAYTLFLWKP